MNKYVLFPAGQKPIYEFDYNYIKSCDLEVSQNSIIRIDTVQELEIDITPGKMLPGQQSPYLAIMSRVGFSQTMGNFHLGDLHRLPDLRIKPGKKIIFATLPAHGPIPVLEGKKITFIHPDDVAINNDTLVCSMWHVNSTALKSFWELYDKYIQTGNKDMRGELSSLLCDIEVPDRRQPLLRPEIGWNEVVGWQILRSQGFIFTDAGIFHLHAGEIIVQDHPYDRDVFVTRFPQVEEVSGKLLKHGFKMTHDDKGDLEDYEWNQIVRAYGITNEKGLYLPIYERNTLHLFCDQKVEEMKKAISDTIANRI